MQCTTVFSIELSDQDLAGLHDDFPMQAIAQRKQIAGAPLADDYDLIEIELTPEEIDKLLSGE